MAAAGTQIIPHYSCTVVGKAAVTRRPAGNTTDSPTRGASLVHPAKRDPTERQAVQTQLLPISRPRLFSPFSLSHSLYFFFVLSCVSKLPQNFVAHRKLLFSLHPFALLLLLLMMLSLFFLGGGLVFSFSFFFLSFHFPQSGSTLELQSFTISPSLQAPPGNTYCR